MFRKRKVSDSAAISYMDCENGSSQGIVAGVAHVAGVAGAVGVAGVAGVDEYQLTSAALKPTWAVQRTMTFTAADLHISEYADYLSAILEDDSDTVGNVLRLDILIRESSILSYQHQSCNKSNSFLYVKYKHEIYCTIFEIFEILYNIITLDDFLFY